MDRLPALPLLLAFTFLALMLPLSAGPGPFEVIRSSPDGLELELQLPPQPLVESGPDGAFVSFRAPGFARLDEPGKPALPFAAALLAVPDGAIVEVRILEADAIDLGRVQLPASSGAEDGGGYESDDGADASPEAVVPALATPFVPDEIAVAEYLGILRGVTAYSLRVYPLSYDGDHLTGWQRLRIQVLFERGPTPIERAKTRLAPATTAGRTLYAPFLNASQAPAMSRNAPRPAGKTAAAAEWYDPARPWVKLLVDDDGIYRVTGEWLKSRQVDIDAIDPASLQLFYLGEELPLFVSDEGDEGGDRSNGHLGPGDYLLFHGRFRRDVIDGREKDFDSLYGRRNTYWLTWGGEPGRRYTTRSAPPLNDYPESGWFAATAHFERDLWYQSLADAPDNRGDHWFWMLRQPVTSLASTRRGSQTFVGNLPAPDLRGNYTTRVRVALHGSSSLQHHTFLELNRHEIDETLWEGQEELVVEREVPSSFLESGINRILVQTLADRAPFDLVFFNWFEIDYRRRYETGSGYLAFDEAATDGRRITVTGLSHPRVELFDVANAIRLVDMEVSSIGETWRVTFEDRSDTPSSYAIVDSLNIRVPLGLVDTSSDLRSPAHVADYIIIYHPRFHAAARSLADHRAAFSGLTVKLVATDDIYDEFSYGRFASQAVQDFIAHAYHNWQGRPAYVLLLGDETHDYRMILRGPPPSFVPSLYYNARKRGNSPSDYLYALVDGDDLLADLAIGRLAVNSSDEARGAVEKIIRYDLDLEPGDWRSRVIYLANWHEKGIFTKPHDALAERFTEPYGLASVKIANPDRTHAPNQTGREFVDALNDGALLVNFAGHGSSGNMQFIFALQAPDWGYLGQVDNGRRIPLVLALSCLNGMFVDPTAVSLAQVFTSMADGGAIAYISASALSFVAQNDLLAENIYEQIFDEGQLAFGPVLNTAKARVLAAHSSYVTAARTMLLFGDPAQKLALPTVADYQPVRLEVTSPQVLSHTQARVEVTLRNNTRLTADSLALVILGRSDLAGAAPDTLFARLLEPFVGDHTLSFDWPVGDRAGSYTLDLQLDPDNRIREANELNNDVQLSLQILRPLLPEPLFPADGAIVSTQQMSLIALVPFDLEGEAGDFACEFALAATPDFDDMTTIESPPVGAAGGRCLFRPAALPDAATIAGSSSTPLFWRSRLLDGGNPGPWTETETFRVGAAPTDPLPPDTRIWRQADIQLLSGDTENLQVSADGGLRISTESLPARPSSPTRESGFTVRGLGGAGVLATDGTYLYAKRWFNDDSTVYPGSDFFMRIGTGFNGTVEDLFYGFLADSTTAGISATYHSDGFIYSESGHGFELERLSPATGKLDTVAVPDGLLEWKLGRVGSLGHALITSDGRYIYNVSMSSPAGSRTGWGVRVFDPADDWRLVREFVSPPTETGFTFMWTDGIFADGERLYFIEFGDRRRIRMVDAVDGHFLDEWTSDQDTTRIISGQYDWLNNKVWLGDLKGSAIFRYTGLGRIESGDATSDPVGPARSWQVLLVEGAVEGDDSGSLILGIEAEAADGRWQTLAGYDDLPVGQSVDISGIDAAAHPTLRLRAHLADTTGRARLDAWELHFQPQALLEVSDADARMDSSGLLVRVAVRNLSPFPVAASELVLEQTDGTAVARQPLANLGRGESRVVSMEGLSLPPVGVGLFARLVTPQGPAGDRLEIPLLFAGRARLTFSLWPSDHTFASGDPLRPGQGIVISAPRVEAGRLLLAIDGGPLEPVAPDSLLDSFDGTTDDRLRFVFRPQVESGRHRLSVQLLSGSDQVGSQELVFALVDALTLGHVLLYPHPLVERSDFAYALSHDAEVSVEIFSLGGRLVQTLGPLAQTAGFGRIEWNGRDAGGRKLTNGTYFYRLRAVSAEGDGAEARGPVIVLR